MLFLNVKPCGWQPQKYLGQRWRKVFLQVGREFMTSNFCYIQMDKSSTVLRKNIIADIDYRYYNQRKQDSEFGGNYIFKLFGLENINMDRLTQQQKLVYFGSNIDGTRHKSKYFNISNPVYTFLLLLASISKYFSTTDASGELLKHILAGKCCCRLFNPCFVITTPAR